MNRTLLFFVSAMLVLHVGDVSAQTPGKIPKFDQPATGTCNAAGGNNCIDSVITQDPSGNIGIGTPTPAAQLDVAGGNVNLEVSTATAGNILKGGALFLHNFGTNNTFLGKNAGNLTLTNGENTAMGFQALRDNTGGCCNTASGSSALQNNTDGSFNSASGQFALTRNTTGSSNTASGTSALFNNTTGNQNTAVGVLALANNTTGIYNTATGVQALANNCPTPCTGGEIDLGVANTADGYQALYSNTIGYNNTAVGSLALYSNTEGQENTAIGFQALYNNCPSPCFGGGGTRNTATGLSALQNNTTGSANTATGLSALLSNTTGTANTAVGAGADVSRGDLTNATAIGANAIVSRSHSLVLGSNANVGIGTSAPEFKLDVAAQAHATSFVSSSDVRFKTNVTPLTGVLEKLEQMRGVSFEWNERYRALGRSTGHKEIGLVAQEVEAVFPELVTTWGDEEYRAVDYGRLTAILVEAIKEQQVQMKELKAEIEGLKAKLSGERQISTSASGPQVH